MTGQTSGYLYTQSLHSEGIKPAWVKLPSSVRGSVVSAYATVLDVQYDPENMPADVVQGYRGPLYFDFDGEELPDTAKDVVDVVGRLAALDVDADDIQLFASGGRGFHLLIDQRVLGLAGDEFTEHLPKIYGDMAVAAFYTRSTDCVVYSGGKGRMLRVENQQRENGRFKVRITLDELRAIANGSLDYFELVAAPREAAPASTREPKMAKGLRQCFLDCQQFTIRRLAEAQKRKRKFVKLDVDDQKQHAILSGVYDFADGVGWHEKALQFAILLRDVGMSKDDAIAAIQPLAEQHRGNSGKSLGERLAKFAKMFDYVSGNTAAYPFSPAALCGLFARPQELGTLESPDLEAATSAAVEESSKETPDKDLLANALAAVRAAAPDDFEGIADEVKTNLKSRKNHCFTEVMGVAKRLGRDLRKAADKGEASQITDALRVFGDVFDAFYDVRTDETFARRKGTPQADPIRSETVKARFAVEFAKDTGKTLVEHTRELVLARVSDSARVAFDDGEASTFKVFTRSANVGDAIYFDEGPSGRIFKSAAGGVTVVDDCGAAGVLFSRGVVQFSEVADKPCPVDALAVGLRLSKQALVPVLAVIINNWLRKVEQPIIEVSAAAGSGKTTLAKRLARLMAGEEVNARQLPTSSAEFAASLSGERVVIFDNLRGITKDMSDKMAAAATGGQHTTRKLYTEAGKVNVTLDATMILTAISGAVSEHDLVQRCVFLYPKRERADQRDLSDQEWADLLPKARRLVLELAGLVQGLLPSFLGIPEGKMHRFNDYNRIGAAIYLALGTIKGDGSCSNPQEAWAAWQADMAVMRRIGANRVIENSNVMQALNEIRGKNDVLALEWSILLAKVIEKKPRVSRIFWPTSVNSLRSVIAELMGPLQESGWVVEARNSEVVMQPPAGYNAMGVAA